MPSKEKHEDPLSSLAQSKLFSMDPEVWDTDARTLWEMEAKNLEIWDNRSEADRAAAWSAALRGMGVKSPVKHKKYQRIRNAQRTKTPIEPYKIDWPGMCIGGQTDSVTYSLILLVEGVKVDLTLSSVQLANPEYVIHRIKNITGKFNIVNEFKGDLAVWENDVVAVWWQALARTEHQDEVQTCVTLIKQFCRMHILDGAKKGAFEQTAKAIEHNGSIFVAWEAILRFVKKEIGDKLTNNALSGALSRLGFTKEIVRETASRQRFWVINKSTLYDTTTGEAWDGQEQGIDFPSSDIDEGLEIDFILKKERSGSTTENQNETSLN